MTAFERFSDEELIALLQEGDHSAYAEIFKRYNALLYAYAYKRLNDREASKDMVQEVFLNLWNKRGTMQIESLAGYLYRSLRNRALNIFAHKKVEQQYVDSLQNFLPTDNSTTDYLLREKEIKALIDREIELMPKGMREVFILSRWHHMTHKEIAEHLDMSEEAVNKQIKRALKNLRVKLGLFTYILVCCHLTFSPQKTKVSDQAIAEQACHL